MLGLNSSAYHSSTAYLSFWEIFAFDNLDVQNLLFIYPLTTKVFVSVSCLLGNILINLSTAWIAPISSLSLGIQQISFYSQTIWSNIMFTKINVNMFAAQIWRGMWSCGEKPQLYRDIKSPPLLYKCGSVLEPNFIFQIKLWKSCLFSYIFDF